MDNLSTLPPELLFNIASFLHPYYQHHLASVDRERFNLLAEHVSTNTTARISELKLNMVLYSLDKNPDPFLGFFYTQQRTQMKHKTFDPWSFMVDYAYILQYIDRSYHGHPLDDTNLPWMYRLVTPFVSSILTSSTDMDIPSMLTRVFFFTHYDWIHPKIRKSRLSDLTIDCAKIEVVYDGYKLLQENPILRQLMEAHTDGFTKMMKYFPNLTIIDGLNRCSEEETKLLKTIFKVTFTESTGKQPFPFKGILLLSSSIAHLRSTTSITEAFSSHSKW